MSLFEGLVASGGMLLRLQTMLTGKILKLTMQKIVTATSKEDASKTAALAQSATSRTFSLLVPMRADVQKTGPEKIGQCRVFTFKPASVESEAVNILIHGGGFIVGGEVTHGPYASEIAAASKRVTYLLAYPLFSEATLPEMVTACMDALQALVIDVGKEFSLFGDSAGGFLACQVMRHLWVKKQSMPDRLYLLSPLLQSHLDYNNTEVAEQIKTDLILGPSYEYLMANPIDRLRFIEWMKVGACCQVLDFPRSMVEAMPPMHVTYDRGEVLAPEIQAWIKACRDCGVKVVDNSVDKVFHVFPLCVHLPQSAHYFEALEQVFRENRARKKDQKTGVCDQEHQYKP